MAMQFREGQFFLVPVERGMSAVGLIARVSRRGGVLLGYFFGPRRQSLPDAQWLQSRSPEAAVLACRFKDTALFQGEWRLLDSIDAFDRSRWPVPAFHRFDGSVTHIPGNSAVTDWRVEYGDDNLIVPRAEAPAGASDLKLGEDAVYDTLSLIELVRGRVSNAVPSADDALWR